MTNSIYILLAIVLLLIFMIPFVVVSYVKLVIQENRLIKINKELIEMQIDNSETLAEYSEKILEFTNALVSQVAVLKYRTFVDTHQMDKITKSNVQELAKLVAETVYYSINTYKINFEEDTLFTKEFYESYIIDTSTNAVKSLLDKTINSDE